MASASTRQVAAATGAKRTTESASTTVVAARTSPEPARKAFHPAWSAAAASARSRADRGTGRRLRSRVEDDRDRAVVHERDLHAGSEYASCDGDALPLEHPAKALVEKLGL